MAGRLAGKRAIVSAAASGIGSATVRRFISEGARVAMLDRKANRLHRLPDQLGGRGPSSPTSPTSPPWPTPYGRRPRPSAD